MNSTPDRNRRLTIYLPLVLAIVLLAGFYLGLHLRLPGSGQAEKKFFSIGLDRQDKLNQVLNYIFDAYVDSIDREYLTNEAIQSMLRDLDPHSAYIPASEFREMNDPLMGSFEGIGIEFNMINDTVVVISPISGGPSEKAGIMAGDRIIAVEDDPIAGVRMSTDEVVSLLKGKKGTEVSVTVLRRNVTDPLDFNIIRDQIPSYSLDIAYMAEGDIGYIRLNKFSATTHTEFLLATEQLKAQGMEKMVLDLRGNGGGFLDAAINLADELLGEEQLIVYTDGRRRPRNYAFARRQGSFETQPLVILIDEWSASASEIVAGAVQDNDRGLIIGRRSFGKGLVQEQVPLGDGSALRLTVARYYTPTGRSIQKPYDNGRDDYYGEFMQRFLEGELDHADSIHFDDSLRFETPGGRVVYGGGGIMPDIFIPLETGEHTVLFNQAANRGLIYRFAFDYSDRHRTAIGRHEDAAAFVRDYRVSDALYRDFMDFAGREGLRPGQQQDHTASEELIRNYLKAYIGRNVYGNEAFFPVLHQSDPAFRKAMEVLHSGSAEALPGSAAED
jgi:carboxyl-terminal processing protease